MSCIYCDEAIEPHEAQDALAAGRPVHLDCLMRQVIGSVAHVNRRCSCFIPGSTENDPPGMTRKQAAHAAVEAMRIRNLANILNVDGHCPLCGRDEFHPGPRGGVARNIMCAHCGAKFWYCPPMQPQALFNSPTECYDLKTRERLPRGTMPPGEDVKCRTP